MLDARTHPNAVESVALKCNCTCVAKLSTAQKGDVYPNAVLSNIEYESPTARSTGVPSRYTVLTELALAFKSCCLIKYILSRQHVTAAPGVK